MSVEYVYRCDHCGEKVLDKDQFFQKYNKNIGDYSLFKSREYNTEFYIVITDRELCVPCAKKAIIDIGQQFLTDKVTGKEEWYIRSIS